MMFGNPQNREVSLFSGIGQNEENDKPKDDPSGPRGPD